MTHFVTKSKNIEADEFDDDLILMNLATRQVLVLNAAAKILWQAMDEFPSGDDLLALLTEAMPNLSRDEAAAALGELLAKLAADDFLTLEGAAS